MKLTVIIQIALIFVIGTGWVKNIIKLSACDFKAPYKAEIIHTTGIIPLIGVVTGWLDIGK